MLEGASSLDEARRRRATRHLRDRLPPSRPFEAWLDATGATVPDFPALPCRPGLWSPVADDVPWPVRREEIRENWRTWLLGALPEPRIDALRRDGDRVVLRTHGVAICLVVERPAAALEPQPLLLVQSSHVGWAAAARRRGWATCVVSAADGDDDSAALPFTPSMIARRAYALTCAVSALRELGDGARIVVAGHSRNGKAALVAAAFDERIAAAVSSSSGVLGAIPIRLCADRHGGEGVELLTRHYPDWYVPGLRCFAGREAQLPTDAHELLAAVAPRPVLVSVGERDQVESTWAAGESVDAARDAYRLLGAPGAIELQTRPGEHRADDAAVEGYLRWAERALGADVAEGSPTRVDAKHASWPADRVADRTAGDARSIAAWLRTDRRAAPALTTLGDGPQTALWLGPLCRPTGWRIGYEQAVPLPELLAQSGFTVVCHDLAGTGARQREAPDLRRHVADARAVLDVTGPAFVAAYGAGALAGAHLAAVDPRVTGAALVGPLTGEPLLHAPPPHTLADVLAAAAPAPLLLATPLVDPAGDAAASARAAAGLPHVEHLTLDDHHRLSAETRYVLRAWLAARRAAAPQAA